MTFNYFRIVVTLLASFGAFFAYICRLNLSLTINEMVLKTDCPPFLDQCNLTETIDGDFPSPSLINTEEHTLAWIARSSHHNRLDTRKIKINRLHDKRGTARTGRLAKNSNYELSIVFDVSRGGDATEQTQQQQISTTAVPSEELDQSVANTTREPPHLLNWNEEDRNNLLGAFFLGYVIAQIPSARAAEMFGAKYLFLVTGFGASICSLAFPFAAKLSPSINFAYLTRFIMGASQGALFPATYVFLCEWLPRSERSKWLPVPSAFSRIGTIVMNLVLPIIIINYNWESVFYISGMASLIWCIVFIVFGSNSPQQSRWISKQELLYIESHMEPRVGTASVQHQKSSSIVTGSGFSINETASKTLSKPSVDWRKVATNKAILMLSLVMFTSEWSNMLLLVKLPGFLGPVLGLDLMEIGFWSSVLICIYCVQYPLSGYCASKLESAGIESLNSLRVRKIFEAAAHLMQGTGCFMIAFSSNKVLVLTALFILMLGRSTVGGGQCLMPPELSKDYPGTVFAFANTIANVAGIIGPLTVTWLVVDPKEHSSWFSLWMFSGALFFVGGLVFCLLADNKPQNYCKKPGKSGFSSTSQAQLTPAAERTPVEEIAKMDAFSRVSSEPKPEILGKQRLD